MPKDLINMNLQLFAEAGDDGGAEQLDNLLKGLDGGTPTEPTEPTEPTNPTVPPIDGDDPKQIAPPTTKPDKANAAFAALRSQNTQYKTLINKVATSLGIDFKDEQELIEKLNDDALSKMAQKQNVPVELLKKMESLEADSAAFKQEQLKSAALIGFQKVKDTYKLTDDELTAFAIQLDENNLNPFVSPVDMMKEYRNLNFDSILQKEIEAAVQEALKRDSAANNHSSKPNPKGAPPKTGASSEEVTTVKGLNDLLNTIIK